MADFCDITESVLRTRDPRATSPTGNASIRTTFVLLSGDPEDATVTIDTSESPPPTPPEYGYLDADVLSGDPPDYIDEQSPLPPIPGEDDFTPQPPPPPDFWEPPPPGYEEFYLADQTLTGAPRPDADQVQAPTDDEGENNPYLSYTCTIEYQYDSGFLHLPVAQEPSEEEPSVPSVLIRTHAPLGKKIVRYTAERAGSQPLVPAPETGDPNMALLQGSVMPEQPRLDPGGNNWIYKVNAVYIYALEEPVTHDEGFTVGAPAYSTLTAADTFLQSTSFVQGITDLPAAEITYIPVGGSTPNTVTGGVLP